MTEINLRRLLECLDYDPVTGRMAWKKTNPRGADLKGRSAGSICADGYIRVRVDGQHYSAHRLAWLFVHGTMPSSCVDHINGDKTDNRIENLREATRQQNGMNTPRPSTNTTGIKNVSRNRGGFLVSVKARGKTSSRWFKDINEAAACAQEMRRSLHGEFANHG